jgi:hypothetical protein
MTEPLPAAGDGTGFESFDLPPVDLAKCIADAEARLAAERIEAASGRGSMSRAGGRAAAGRGGAGSIDRSGGRDGLGRFAAGNTCGRGNPMARRAQRLRIAMLRAVTPADVADLVRAMLNAAKSGDTAAARLLLEHCIGRPGPGAGALPGPGPGADDLAEPAQNRRYIVTFDDR